MSDEATVASSVTLTDGFVHTTVHVTITGAPDTLVGADRDKTVRPTRAEINYIQEFGGGVVARQIEFESLVLYGERDGIDGEIASDFGHFGHQGEEDRLPPWMRDMVHRHRPASVRGVTEAGETVPEVTVPTGGLPYHLWALEAELRAGTVGTVIARPGWCDPIPDIGPIRRGGVQWGDSGPTPAPTPRWKLARQRVRRLRYRAGAAVGAWRDPDRW